jgi:ATP-dependent DNA helicase RecG
MTSGQGARATGGAEPGRPLRRLAEIGVGELRRVGRAKTAALSEMGISSVLDLVTHYPRRYVDRTQQASLSDMKVGDEAMVLMVVRRVNARRTRHGRSLVEVDVSDGTGYLRCSFFNQPWRAKQLTPGTEAVLFGRLEVFRGRRHMTNPVVDLVGGDKTGRIVPIYPQSDKAGLTSWELADFVEEALRRAGPLADPLPERWRARLRLMSRTEAMAAIHAPPSLEAVWPARRRLVFDELLRLQCVLVMRKRATERQARGICHPVGGGEGASSVVAEFRRRLPFALTGAQERAIAEILADLARDQPMHRLLQGDVGAGKTVVAVAALLAAVEGGHQGALMAPTEVLAEQHLMGVRELVGGLSVPDPGTLPGSRPLRVELLTHRTTPAERAQLHGRLRSGATDILVGTHALLAEEVAFRSLGVVVIDEQHRFGVEQRAVLREKGEAEGATPDVLVMTATPIPRTAAMTVFGDLDVTVLDERPAGRPPVATTWARSPAEVTEAWQRVRWEAARGRRAYVVCPLVEESERIQAASATEEHRRLSESELAGLRLGLLHGQMTAPEKEEVMGRFRSGELDVLVATTVIEVGVDVPEATVMIVEDAPRFGMAQLHQLRGRVGRGPDPAFCYLLGEAPTPEAEQRLLALERSTDGFELAEVDLELRGEGTILGTRQTGRNDLKLASLRRDKELVALAREAAFELVDSSPGLADYPLLAEEVRLFVDPAEEEFLFKS